MESAQGAPISSTRIREALAAGDVVRAAQMMDTAHRISGVVSRGDGRGRTIGFPTANLDQVDVIIPAPGVYAGWASRDSGDRQATGDDAPALAAAIHIGESPTFQSGSRSKVEVHLLDHSGDLYGETLTVHFVDRVRGVQRFGSADELIAQLNQDLLRIRRILDPPPPQGNS
jgi:riboflavin kinase/FMN adenylyltransferase